MNLCYRGLQESLTRVLTNVQDIHPEDILSDVSMLSGIESWKPMKVKPLNAMSRCGPKISSKLICGL